MFSLPISIPAKIAISKPISRYNAATFQPNSPNSKIKATSFTIGAEIRNENVTPNGTPACRKPINSGTAEHEQNGVTIPNVAAIALPTPKRLPDNMARVRSGEMKVWIMPITNTMPVSNSNTFGVS